MTLHRGYDSKQSVVVMQRMIALNKPAGASSPVGVAHSKTRCTEQRYVNLACRSGWAVNLERPSRSVDRKRDRPMRSGG